MPVSASTCIGPFAGLESSLEFRGKQLPVRLQAIVTYMSQSPVGEILFLAWLLMVPCARALRTKRKYALLPTKPLSASLRTLGSPEYVAGCCHPILVGSIRTGRTSRNLYWPPFFVVQPMSLHVEVFGDNLFELLDVMLTRRVVHPGISPHIERQLWYSYNQCVPYHRTLASYNHRPAVYETEVARQVRTLNPQAEDSFSCIPKSHQICSRSRAFC